MSTPVSEIEALRAEVAALRNDVRRQLGPDSTGAGEVAVDASTRGVKNTSRDRLNDGKWTIFDARD